MNKINNPFKSNNKTNLGLHNAAATGNIGLVKFALEHGQSINSLMNGLLPIHVATCYGQIQIVKYLIEMGCDVNGRRKPRRYSGSLLLTRNKNEIGSTALHFAAANGNLELIKLLLENGALVHTIDKYGSTPLSIALAKHDIQAAVLMTEYLIQQQPSIHEMMKKEDNKLDIPIDVYNVDNRRRSMSDMNQNKPVSILGLDINFNALSKSTPPVSFFDQSAKLNLVKI